MENIFFDSWASLLRVFTMTVLAYVSMVILLRVSGKRTLAKLNAFDFVVTVALGSTLATVALNKSITLAEGALAFGTLILLQFIITWLSVRSKSIRELVTSKPMLLLYRGEMLSSVMKNERITVDELCAAARQQQISDLKDVAAIILETTGDLTVIPNLSPGHDGALLDVGNYPPSN